VPQTDSRQAPNDRIRRERLLAALLEVFPTAELHPYAEASERYQNLFQGRRDAEVRGMLVARMAHLMRRWRKFADDQLKRRGQNLIRFQMLFELAINEDGETLTSIATRVGVAGPQIVGVLEELERDGLIERTIDENDRRAKLIVLTPAGEQTVSSLFELELKLRADLLRGVGMSEMLLMLDTVATMTENLDTLTT
jgi:MarR family transcriptional regulator for hemolysin